jgi:hypothetical protein
LNKKIAANGYATAAETSADGEKRAAIKKLRASGRPEFYRQKEKQKRSGWLMSLGIFPVPHRLIKETNK